MANRIFFSWSGELSRLVATEIYEWIKELVDIPTFLSFRDIEIGSRWPLRLWEELEKDNKAFLFLTRENQNSEWILYEVGSIGKKYRTSRLAPILIDITSSELPTPLQNFQAARFSKPELRKAILDILGGFLRGASKVRRIRRISGNFNAFWPNLERKVKKYQQDTLESGGNWGLVSEMKAAKNVNSSPFEAIHAIRIAKQELIFVGQNLHFLIRGRRGRRLFGHWNEIRDFLKSQEKNKVSIVIMNPDNRELVQAWNKTMGKDFKGFLNACFRELTRWRRRAEREGISGRLFLYLANFMPASLTFIDPRHEEGKMFFTNPIANQVISPSRPCFLIKKRENSDIFDYFFIAYQDLFDNPRSIYGRTPALLEI